MKQVINTSDWIVAYTKPKHEYAVLDKLSKAGFVSYIPTIRERRKWSDRKKWIEVPLFKSYVFINTEPKNSLSVSKINGIVRIVKFGNEIAIVNDNIIEIMKKMIKGGYIPKSESYFLKGEFVKVVDGPLKGLEGVVLNKSGENRLMIRIDAIQQSVSVSINKGFLKKRPPVNEKRFID